MLALFGFQGGPREDWWTACIRGFRQVGPMRSRTLPARAQRRLVAVMPPCPVYVQCLARAMLWGNMRWSGHPLVAPASAFLNSFIARYCKWFKCKWHMYSRASLCQHVRFIFWWPCPGPSRIRLLGPPVSRDPLHSPRLLESAPQGPLAHRPTTGAELRAASCELLRLTSAIAKTPFLNLTQGSVAWSSVWGEKSWWANEFFFQS